MPAFQKGNQAARGANHTKERRITQQLIAELNEAAEGGGTKLRKIVIALLDKAMSGDVAAIREVMDRVDGKVPIAIGGPDGDEPIKHELVVRFVDRDGLERDRLNVPSVPRMLEHIDGSTRGVPNPSKAGTH